MPLAHVARLRAGPNRRGPALIGLALPFALLAPATLLFTPLPGLADGQAITIRASDVVFTPAGLRLTAGQPIQFTLANAGAIDLYPPASLPRAGGPLSVLAVQGRSAQVTFTHTTPGHTADMAGTCAVLAGSMRCW